MALDVRVLANPEAYVVSVSGEIDSHSVEALDRALNRVLQQAAVESKHLLVDLTEVDFMDSSGIGVLIKTRTALPSQVPSYQVVAPTSRVKKVLAITGVDQLITVVDLLTDTTVDTNELSEVD